MENFDDEIGRAIEAGQANLRAMTLVRNWCFHAEITRSGGRGMIEEMTNLPIGHMGMQCKYSKSHSMQSWRLEDAAYDFYINNCKGCTKRVHVGLPNISAFIGPREQAAELRKKEREKEEDLRKQNQDLRRQARAKLRHESSLEESFVLDLLDELDQDSIDSEDPRLEQLAKLAPETFTRNIILHVLPDVLCGNLPYSISAGKALLKASLEDEERLLIAIRLIKAGEMSTYAVDIVLSKSEAIPSTDLPMIVRRFATLALGAPPGQIFGSVVRESLDSRPIRQLFASKSTEISSKIKELLSDPRSDAVQDALEIILATNDSDLLLLHARTVISKLMRRRTLFPNAKKDSATIYYLRKAAEKLLEISPTSTDLLLESYLADNDEIGRKEYCKVYYSVLNQPYDEAPRIGQAQRIAFRRLLWSAVQSPTDSGSEAAHFFLNPRERFEELAAFHFDDMIGAAATLGRIHDDERDKGLVDVPENLFSGIDKRNKLSAIDRLQGALISWAAKGANFKGVEGIEDFLRLYRGLPNDQILLRGKMIGAISLLLTDVRSINLILSDWYRAILDEHSFIRASAIEAWEKVPRKLIENFPNLFIESVAVLLTDPYIIVHKAAVRTLRHNPLPQEHSSIIQNKLWSLILHYSNTNKQDEFTVDCIETLISTGISAEQIEGSTGKFLSEVTLRLEQGALYRAIEHLGRSLKNAPDFTKVATKAIQDNYIRSISIDSASAIILRASKNELRNCSDDLISAFNNLDLSNPTNFSEALLYVASLSSAGLQDLAEGCLLKITENIPNEDRATHWLLQASLVSTSSRIEKTIKSGITNKELFSNWKKLTSDLEKENEARAKTRNFPPDFFFEN
ncbi:hypothetical protein HFV06_20720 [Pseudomonas fluorescens]|nr:hypothetical protein [Pseudomonas fluorescens]NKI55918.1 hypothetical protein [Pseudomonas fluorescens]NKI66262.1 hypothetical protein [Pseudomonas fluorescens]